MTQDDGMTVDGRRTNRGTKAEEKEKFYCGRELRAFRHLHGYTQPELQALSGLKEETISRLENNKKTLSLNLAIKLANVYGVKLSEFFSALED